MRIAANILTFAFMLHVLHATALAMPPDTAFVVYHGRTPNAATLEAITQYPEHEHLGSGETKKDRCKEGLYYFDAARNRVTQVLGPPALCMEQNIAVRPMVIDKNDPKKPKQVDYYRSFVPYANSRVAISQDKKWLAVTGRVVQSSRQSGDSIYDHYRAMPNEYRILLVRLRDVQSSNAQVRMKAVLNVFDTSQQKKHRRFVAERPPKDATGLPVRMFNIPMQDTPIPFDLSYEFGRNPLLETADKPHWTSFDWGPSPIIDIEFAENSYYLYVRVLTDAAQAYTTPFGESKHRLKALGSRKDLGVHRSFVLDLSPTQFPIRLPHPPLTIATMHDRFKIKRAVIPNQRYYTTSTLVHDRKDLVAFTLHPTGRALAYSRLRRISEPGELQARYLHQLELRQDHFYVEEPPELCRDTNIQLHSSYVADEFDLQLSWQSGQLVYRANKQSLRVMSTKAIRRSVARLENARIVDVENITDEQADALMKRECDSLDVSPWFMTDQSSLTFHDESFPKHSKQLIGKQSATDIHLRGNLLVATYPILSRRAPGTHVHRTISPPFPKEITGWNAYAGLPVLFDMENAQVRLGVYPVMEETDEEEPIDLLQWLKSWALNSPTKPLVKHPRLFHRSHSGPPHFIPESHFRDYVSNGLSANLRHSWIDAFGDYLYFLEYREPNRFVDTIFHDDLADLGAGPFISRIPIESPAESNIERLTFDGFVGLKNLFSEAESTINSIVHAYHWDGSEK